MLPMLKCDSAAREAVAHGSLERMAVIVRVHGVADAVRSKLEESGLKVHSTTGPIASGEIDPGQLESLAQLSCVRRIELSRALFAE